MFVLPFPVCILDTNSFININKLMEKELTSLVGL